MSWVSSPDSALSGGWLSSQYAGLGATGAAINAASSGGESGVGPLYGLGLADASEYYWRVTAAPGSGSLTIYEDGSFSHTGAADGSWSWTASVYADGVLSYTLTITDTLGIVIPPVVIPPPGPQPYPQRLGEGPLYPSPKGAAKTWAAMLKKITAQSGLN